MAGRSLYSARPETGRRTLGASGTFQIPMTDYTVYRVPPANFDGKYPPDPTPPTDAVYPRGHWGAATQSNHPIERMTVAPPQQVYRGCLEWAHLPEERWESEMQSAHRKSMQEMARTSRPVSGKRHGDYYYQSMSGRGTPSQRSRELNGFTAPLWRGLGNVTNQQVPHSANFPMPQQSTPHKS